MTKTPMPDDAATANAMPVIIHAQYIKDLSFENPFAPDTLKPSATRPETDIGFSMDVRNIEFGDSDRTFEVTLGVSAKAVKDGRVIFLVEVQYALVVSLHNVAEDKMHPLLLMEMPRYAFPFVRQIIADLTQQAGYAPLLLSPVDFRSFYMQKFAQQEARAQA